MIQFLKQKIRTLRRFVAFLNLGTCLEALDELSKTFLDIGSFN